MSVITIDSWFFGDFVCFRQEPAYLVVTMEVWEHSHVAEDSVAVTLKPIRHEVDIEEYL